MDPGGGDDEPVGGILVLPFGKAGGVDGESSTVSIFLIKRR